MSGFEKYKPKTQNRAGGCPICGAPGAGAVTVSIRDKKRRHITGTSVSFCEEHCVEIGDALSTSLEKHRAAA